MPQSHWHTITDSPEETRRLGIQIGEALQPGDFLAINGPLGAGKTVLVQGILQGLGVEDFEGSPTFILAQTYSIKGSKWEVLHLDAYRLGPEADEAWRQLGWDEWLDSKAILLVEWADYLAELLPPDRLEIRLEIPSGQAEDTRKIFFLATGEQSCQLLEDVRRSLVS